jgi:hypothetical protein
MSSFRSKFVMAYAIVLQAGPSIDIRQSLRVSGIGRPSGKYDFIVGHQSDDLRRVADYYRPIRHVSCYDRARTDEGILANGHAWTQDAAATHSSGM